MNLQDLMDAPRASSLKRPQADEIAAAIIQQCERVTFAFTNPVLALEIHLPQFVTLSAGKAARGGSPLILWPDPARPVQDAVNGAHGQFHPGAGEQGLKLTCAPSFLIAQAQDLLFQLRARPSWRVKGTPRMLRERGE